MKHIIITGKNGYIANSLKNWIEKRNIDIDVNLMDLKDKNWRSVSFANIDAIIHTAALVHKNEAEISIDDYRKINTDLTIEVANKAKNEGVKQFIYISTMAVFGIEISCFKSTEIIDSTPLSPKSKYGISKYEAEIKLNELTDKDFSVAIIRPPFVYGKNCPGNYGTLRKLTLKIGIIPKIKNTKSMIYIDNLCEFIYQILELNGAGNFMPQNNELQSTYKMALLIAKYNNKRVVCTPLITPLVCVLSLFISKIRKAFGNEFYNMNMSELKNVDYNVVNFEDSIKLTEQ